MDKVAKPAGQDEVEHISAVIADVYDAAMDPDIWRLALEAACEFVDAAAGFLFFQDLAGAAGDAVYAWGDDPDFRQARFEAYARCNPAHLASPPLPPGRARAGSSLFSPAELVQSGIQAGWLAPQDYCDFATVVLERSNTSLTCLTFAAREGDGCVEPPMLRRIELLAPHFRRSGAIAEALGMRNVRADALTEVLDGLSAAVFLVDARGSVVHANASARGMLESARVLDVRRDVLRAVDRGADAAFRAMLTGAADAVPTGPGAPIRLESEEGDHLAQVLPLTTGQRRAAAARFSAVAAVVVRRAALDIGAALQVLQGLHGLTPAEVRVLRAATETAGAREMADALRLSENTVNTHIRRLFEKTGVHRKDELVKLVAAHASPLAS